MARHKKKKKVVGTKQIIRRTKAQMETVTNNVTPEVALTTVAKSFIRRRKAKSGVISRTAITLKISRPGVQFSLSETL